MRYAIALAAMALLASLPPAARAQPVSSVLRWEHIGHIADQKVAWLAVPPDGSASGLLFARTAGTPYSSILDASNPGTGQPTPGTTYRSRDGGKTWEAVTDAPGRVVLPAGGAPAFSLARDGVYRSSDLGASWSAVLPLATEQLVLSPTFGQDGIAFALGQDQLWRTTDTGRTWAHLDPGQGQIVIATALSPAFGSDHTLFAAAVTARPATQQPEPPPTDNIDSAGLLVSQDGGTTWTQVSDGLQTDDGPYHQVVAIGVSPNFAADQTVYVTGLGPWLPPDRAGELCGTCALPSVATFATHDAGGAWQVVDQRPATGARFVSYALGSTLNLSPAFAADRTLLSTLSLGGAAPSSYGCSSEVSTDGGGSWQAAEQQTLGAGLCGIGLLHAAGTTVLLAYQRPYYLSSGPNRDVVHSLDGGATWTILAPPGDGLALGFQPDLAQRQAVLPDRVLQATERGDLWAYAEFAPCANQPVLGFGQVWVQHRDWQESAGCPLGPERPVQVQASHDAANNFDTYWTSAPDAVCVRVSSDYLGNVHSSVLRVGQDCGGAGDRRLGGALLAFPNGQFWLYVPAGPGQGLVITSQGGVASVSS